MLERFEVPSSGCRQCAKLKPNGHCGEPIADRHCVEIVEGKIIAYNFKETTKEEQDNG